MTYMGDVAWITLEHDHSLLHLASASGFNRGPTEDRGAVHVRDIDLDFGSLRAGASLHDPFAEELQAVHPRLDATSDVVAGLRVTSRQVVRCSPILGQDLAFSKLLSAPADRVA